MATAAAHRQRARALLSAAFALACVVTSAPAHAFCRSRVCDTDRDYADIWQDPPDPICKRDDQSCRIEGLPLYWPQTCLSFSVQKDGSRLRGIDYDSLHSTAIQAFESWLKADCGGGKTPSFVVNDRSPVDCGVPEYNQTAPNANVIMFRDGGSEKLDDFTIALTTTNYNVETGEIFDADIELNSADFKFALPWPPPPGMVNLRAVLTHEIGHFLGLSHSNDMFATMWETYGYSQNDQGVLHPDDIAGICQIYPPSRTVDPKHCEPRHGFASACQPDEDESGCALANVPAGGARSAGLFSALSLLFLFRRRRR